MSSSNQLQPEDASSSDPAQPASPLDLLSNAAGSASRRPRSPSSPVTMVAQPAIPAIPAPTLPSALAPAAASAAALTAASAAAAGPLQQQMYYPPHMSGVNASNFYSAYGMPTPTPQFASYMQGYPMYPMYAPGSDYGSSEYAAYAAAAQAHYQRAGVAGIAVAGSGAVEAEGVATGAVGKGRARPVRRKSYTRFTAEEEEALMEGVRIHGVGNWKQILANSSLLARRRSTIQLKDKYRTATRARARLDLARSVHAASESAVNNDGGSRGSTEGTPTEGGGVANSWGSEADEKDGKDDNEEQPVVDEPKEGRRTPGERKTDVS